MKQDFLFVPYCSVDEVRTIFTNQTCLLSRATSVDVSCQQAPNQAPVPWLVFAVDFRKGNEPRPSEPPAPSAPSPQLSSAVW